MQDTKIEYQTYSAIIDSVSKMIARRNEYARNASFLGADAAKGEDDWANKQFKALTQEITYIDDVINELREMIKPV